MKEKKGLRDQLDKMQEQMLRMVPGRYFCQKYVLGGMTKFYQGESVNCKVLHEHISTLCIHPSMKTLPAQKPRGTGTERLQPAASQESLQQQLERRLLATERERDAVKQRLQAETWKRPHR